MVSVRFKRDLRLGFDLDEVVVACIPGISNLVKKEFGVDWRYDNYTCYGFRQMCFTDDKEFNLTISSYLEKTVPTEEFLLALDPYKEAMDTIKELWLLGHSIHFISSRPVFLANATNKWLVKHGIPFDSLYVVGRLVEKGCVCSSLGLDMFVDDEIGHLNSMLKHKNDCGVGLFLLDRPYNRDYVGDEFIRINKLSNVTTYL